MQTAFATARGASAPRPLGWGDARRGLQAGRREGAFPTALPRTLTQQRAGHRDRLPGTVFHNPLPDALLGWYVRHWLSPSRWSIIAGPCAPSWVSGSGRVKTYGSGEHTIFQPLADWCFYQ